MARYPIPKFLPAMLSVNDMLPITEQLHVLSKQNAVRIITDEDRLTRTDRMHSTPERCTYRCLDVRQVVRTPV
jgi:hypothetical protein